MYMEVWIISYIFKEIKKKKKKKKKERKKTHPSISLIRGKDAFYCGSESVRFVVVSRRCHDK